MAARKQQPTLSQRLNLPIFLIALFGVLVVVHLWVQAQAGFEFGCTGAGDAASGSGCAEVTTSIYSSFLGVNLLIWGGLFYLAVAALRVGVGMLKAPLSNQLRTASLAATGAGFLFVIYLVSVQAFILGSFCVLCLVSSGTATLLFGLHLYEWRKTGTAGADERGGAPLAFSMRPYAIGLGALVLLAGADVMILGDRAPEPVVTAALADAPIQQAGQLQQACQYDPELTSFRLFDMFTSGQAAYAGSSDAQARAIKFLDPNCPHCATLHSVLKQVKEEIHDDVRLYYQPIALWDFSIPQVQAMYIARDHSTEAFLQMIDLQLEGRRQGGIPIDVLVDFARQSGLDGEAFRRELVGGKYVELIRSERQMASGAGINSVPRLLFEGRAIANTRATWTPECIEYFANQAARR